MTDHHQLDIDPVPDSKGRFALECPEITKDEFGGFFACQATFTLRQVAGAHGVAGTYRGRITGRRRTIHLNALGRRLAAKGGLVTATLKARDETYTWTVALR